ncbi:MAG: DUF2141 domain-containing protein [Comamonadaceae bacterium]|nr:MAG: DUF2141 domain-containing protein [Comamonadaceae bacterium]
MPIRALTLLAALLAATGVHAADLRVEVTLPAERQGTVLAAVFDQADGFPRGKPLRTATAQPVEGKAVVEFPGLPTGDYAVSVFLDENANLKLDANLFGMPTELYGFSRNARNLAGPPAFADAVMRVEDGAQPPQQAIELK